MTENGGPRHQPDFPELVDIETVATLLGVGERYVRRLVAERRIEFLKVGHYVRFDLDVVRQWVETGRRPQVDSTTR